MTPREKNIEAINQIAYTHGYTAEHILSHSKQRKLVVARRECIAMLRAKGLSTPQIGKIMNRDHSTIVHALQVLEELK